MNDRVDFDQYARDYNKLLQDQTAYFSKSDAYFASYKVKLMKSRLSRPVKRVLEYGCGIGRNIPYLKEAFPEAELVGTEVSHESLKIARQDHPKIKFVGEGPGDLGLGLFDLIFVAGVFHHVPPSERREVSSLLYERLDSSGDMFVFEHNPFNPVTRRIVSNCPYDEGVVLISPRELARFLTSEGFIRPRTEYCLFIPPGLKMLSWLEPKLGWLPLGGQYFVHVSK